MASQRIGKRLNLIIAMVCAATIVLVWLATVQRIASEHKQAVAAVISSNSNLAIAFEQQVYRTLKAAEQVAAFVRDEYLQQGGKIDLRQWVEQGIIRETMFTIISVVDEHGDLVDSSHIRARANYADRPFFMVQRNSVGDELFINPPVVGRVSGEARVPMSLRITRPDGSFGGVVVLSVDPANFTDFYNQADLGSRGMLELTGYDGIVRGRKIGQEGGYGQDAARLPWFHRRAASPEGSFLDEGDALDGVARIISYRSLEGYPLMVTVGTSYADEFAPVFQRRAWYLVATAMASGVLLGLVSLLILLLGRERRAADALQASEALYRATFHQAAAGIAHIRPDGCIQGANQKFHDMFGSAEGELAGRSLIDLSEPEYRNEARRLFMLRIADHGNGGASELEKPYRRKDSSLLWVHEALGVVRDARGQVSYLVAVTQDITARKELEARLSHNAMHDVLTGLPNRNMFYDRLNQALSSARRNGRLAAALYLDLDGFKEVNDVHGHAVGDVLLQHVGRRLERSMRAEDTAARFGGDEFAIVLSVISAEDDCEHVADKLIRVLSEPYDIDGLTIRISASVGAAVFPVHGEDPRSLIAHADAAMYKAKRAHKLRRAEALK